MDFLNDLVAGAIGGVSGVIVGSPFDVLKVRQQAGLGSPSTLKTAVDIVKTEGPQTLFRGILPPIIGNIPLNAIFFASYGYSQRVIEQHFPHQVRPEDMPLPPTELKEKLLASLTKASPGLTMAQLDKNTTYSYITPPKPDFLNIFLSGCFAGFMGSVLTTPIELVKIKEQNYIGGGKVPSSWFIAKDLSKRYGPKSLLQGFWSTFWREAPSCGVYFLVYEWFKHIWKSDEWTPTVIPRQPQSSVNYALPYQVEYHYDTQHSTLALLGAGSLAGIASWISTYPFDCIKTRIQTLDYDKMKNEGRIAYVFRQLLRQNGFKSLFAGITPTLLSAIPVNAVTLLFYERTLEYMVKYEEQNGWVKNSKPQPYNL